MGDDAPEELTKEQLRAENERIAVQFKAQHGLVVAFFILILVFHGLGIYLFCSGFLLSRLILPDRSQCAVLPISVPHRSIFTPGSIDEGCWHPKTFNKAIIILVDALRYDFTVPFRPTLEDPHPHYFHNALPILHDTAVQRPSNAFLRPFIADPPTTTTLRLKGLTTGTLPTFIDAGSNFAGTAIDEDNLVEQMYKAGKKVVHLGDDTWHSLFPGYFEPTLTKPYDSFNVWDLHTVDNGVNEHLFPLLEPEMRDKWDVVIGHYLGVDHAGHRYGPDHPAMTEKLKQMDDVFRRLIDKLDEDTLLVVMGDHGMDVKGDHGGESDDEVQAALWMYSPRPVFGRDPNNPPEPPATAKERSVGQIDLVPTLALLLGLPIPFNNLGQPIEEAFLGPHVDFANLAHANRLTAAQIHRYQAEYSKARGLDEAATSKPAVLWQQANEVFDEIRGPSGAAFRSAFEAFAAYQAENLRICRSLWARFDLISMGMGIAALIGTLAILAMYAHGINADRASLTPVLLAWGLAGAAVGTLVGVAVGTLPSLPLTRSVAFGAVCGGNFGTLLGLWPARHVLQLPFPRTFWGGFCTLATALLSIGFAANSFTIWEDEQLLFLLTTFGILMLGSSLGRPDPGDRALGTMHALSFLVATRLAALSRLCREEQMPFCRSTYYASATSSTSAGWQLALPAIVAVGLPTVVARVYKRTRNYNGSAVVWIRYGLRAGLGLVAMFWLIDAADDGDWFSGVSKASLKTTRVVIAQLVLALAFGAGYATYVMASPLLTIKTEEVQSTPPSTSSRPWDPADPSSPIFTPFPSAPATRKKLIIFGYANTHGTRYVLLPAVWLLALHLVQKPMGQSALALCAVSILNLVEMLDANAIRPHSPLGPVVLALMGSFYFFKTGHQAALATIQWEAAFVPLKTIRYPWSPMLVVLNTYGAQILCALAVPAVVLWKVPPKQHGLLGRVAAAVATHGLFYAAVAVATVGEAAWLRRHLMLYRVFMPRMLLAITSLLVVETVAALIAVVGVRWSVVSVGDVFGWSGT